MPRLASIGFDPRASSPCSVVSLAAVLAAAAALGAASCGGAPPPDTAAGQVGTADKGAATEPAAAPTSPEAPEAASTAKPAEPAPAPAAEPKAPTPSADGMIRIPGGTYKMGNDASDEDERPAHEVVIQPFEMDLTEVTVEAYEACVKAKKCSTPNTYSPVCTWGKPDKRDHPVNCIDWQQAKTYCAFAGKRLPTEEEWEYAARGTDGRTYPWGDAPPSDQLCWGGEGNDLGKGNRKSTCPVGKYRAGASPFGLLDMAGNVWEWTATLYCPYSKKNCSESRRVIRGSGWGYDRPIGIRATNRIGWAPMGRFDHVGFRCAR